MAEPRKLLLSGEERSAETIVFNLCGHGHFDLKAYHDDLSGTLADV